MPVAHGIVVSVHLGCKCCADDAAFNDLHAIPCGFINQRLANCPRDSEIENTECAGFDIFRSASGSTLSRGGDRSRAVICGNRRTSNWGALTTERKRGRECEQQRNE